MEGFYSSHTTREAASAAVVTRPVRLGLATVNGIWPFATHWAVQVEDTWFEVAGASKEEQPVQCAPAPAPILCPLRVRLAALGSSALSGRGRATGRPPLPCVLELAALEATELPAFDPCRRRTRPR